MATSEGGAAPSPAAPEVTQLLRDWRAGDVAAGDRLLEILYSELHAMAHQRMSRERASTIQTTALVHEAYIRLVDQSIDWRDRGHFLALAATMMRRVLVDRARARRAGKRGAGQPVVTLTDTAAIGVDPLVEVLDVDRALERLAVDYARPARVVELRFFGGLELAEIAAVIGVTERTVKRDWAFARAWLARALHTEGER